eukprot:7617767-Pyramimonas_sp.AAC.1
MWIACLPSRLDTTGGTPRRVFLRPSWACRGLFSSRSDRLGTILEASWGVLDYRKPETRER